jgi:four helix bundle protein
MGTYKDLLFYNKVFELEMDIFEISKRFPKEETYSLTDQIKRSYWSVCADFAEAYRHRRRKYPAHFMSKLTDADSENTETEVWLDFAFDFDCKYITGSEHSGIVAKKEEVGRLLGNIFKNPSKYS